jgi:hypothetical protein
VRLSPVEPAPKKEVMRIPASATYAASWTPIMARCVKESLWKCTERAGAQEGDAVVAAHMRAHRSVEERPRPVGREREIRVVVTLVFAPDVPLRSEPLGEVRVAEPEKEGCLHREHGRVRDTPWLGNGTMMPHERWNRAIHNSHVPPICSGVPGSVLSTSRQ